MWLGGSVRTAAARFRGGRWSRRTRTLRRCGFGSAIARRSTRIRAARIRLLRGSACGAVEIRVPATSLEDEATSTRNLTLGARLTTLGAILQRIGGDRLLSLPLVTAAFTEIFVRHGSEPQIPRCAGREAITLEAMSRCGPRPVLSRASWSLIDVKPIPGEVKWPRHTPTTDQAAASVQIRADSTGRPRQSFQAVSRA